MTTDQKLNEAHKLIQNGLYSESIEILNDLASRYQDFNISYLLVIALIKILKKMKITLLTAFTLLIGLLSFSQVTDVDGNEYKIIKIGDQIWLAENLSVSKFSNGDIIPYLKSDSLWNEAIENKTPGWCYFDNDSVNGKILGKLYNYYVLNDPRGISIEGWKVASIEDWEKLSNHLGGNDISGLKLKESTLWQEEHRDNGNNESGFSALPSGGRTVNGFDYFGNTSIAVYWVAPLNNDHLTICLYAHNIDFIPTEFDDSVGFAIRLIKK